MEKSWGGGRGHLLCNMGLGEGKGVVSFSSDPDRNTIIFIFIIRWLEAAVAASRRQTPSHLSSVRVLQSLNHSLISFSLS